MPSSTTNTNTSRNVQVGPGLFGFCIIASIVLAILKLTNVWAISWLVVLLPVLVGLGLNIALLIIFFVIVAIIAVVQSK